MALTIYQTIVLKAMERMTPSRQRSVVQFVANLPKKGPSGRAETPTAPKRRASIGNSVKTRDKPNPEKAHQNTGAKPAKSNLISPKKPKLGRSAPDRRQDNRLSPQPPESGTVSSKPDDMRWLFSENRRKEHAPKGSGSSGQKWTLNQWNHAGS